MYSLLIVDDEESTRNGLLTHIDWSRFGIGMIQTAESAGEALRICEDFQPDIILSDIRMRGMDGVEMCRILNKRIPSAQIIFLSGYSDKAYLKAAIELGAVNYVDKPVDPPVLEQAVEKACALLRERALQKSYREELEENVQYLRRRLFLALIEGDLPMAEQLMQKPSLGGTFLQDGWQYRVLLFTMKQQVVNISRLYGQMDQTLMSAAPDVQYIREYLNTEQLAVILGSAEGTALRGDQPFFEAAEQFAAGGREGQELFLAVGPLVRGFHDIGGSYGEALEILRTLFYRGFGTVAFQRSGDLPVKLSGKAERAYEKAFAARSLLELERALRGIREELVSQQAVKSAVVKNLFFGFANAILSEYEKYFGSDREFVSLKYEELYKKIETGATLDVLISALTDSARLLFAKLEREERNSSAVTRLIRLIEEDYAEKEMSVKTLAERMYLTPTYLSGLFKRKTGKTIGEYIISVRIEKAKELLRDGALKLYHIADRVGYEDPNYFAKIFKKTVGVTPSEYREKLP